MFKCKSLLIGASAILISIALSSNYVRSVEYTPVISDEIAQRDNLITLLEVVSLGDSRAVERLNHIATPQVRDKVSTMCGDSERRIPEPEIWTLSIVDNFGTVVFESNLDDTKTQLYRYTVEFAQGNNKILSLDSEFLYEEDN